VSSDNYTRFNFTKHFYFKNKIPSKIKLVSNINYKYLQNIQRIIVHYSNNILGNVLIGLISGAYSLAISIKQCFTSRLGTYAFSQTKHRNVLFFITKSLKPFPTRPSSYNLFRVVNKLQVLCNLVLSISQNYVGNAP